MAQTQEAQSFQGRYSLAFRCVELGAFAVFFTEMAWLGLRLAPQAQTHAAAIVAALFLGFLTMDFLSGMFHWAGDTWGSVHWPVIGSTVIRTFREHHVDPEAITRHDVVEVNATSCMIAIPWLAYGLWGGAGVFAQAFAMAIGAGAVLTNQIHAWAHRPKNPRWIRALQKSGLILSPEGHAHHHQAPYTDHYCITTGWLNKPFARLRFFRMLERVVTKVTGAEPRAEDRRAEEAVLAAHEMARRNP